MYKIYQESENSVSQLLAMKLLIPAFHNRWLTVTDKRNIFLFILSILSSFYPGQILSAERLKTPLKICPL